MNLLRRFWDWITGTPRFATGGIIHRPVNPLTKISLGFMPTPEFCSPVLYFGDVTQNAKSLTYRIATSRTHLTRERDPESLRTEGVPI